MTERPSHDEIARWENEGGALGVPERSVHSRTLTKIAAIVPPPIALSQSGPMLRERRRDFFAKTAANDA